MTSTYFKQTFSVASGSNTAAVTIPLPVKGKLTAVTVGTNAASSGPGFAAAYFGGSTGTNIFIALVYGVVRGTNFPGDESIYWTGSISLDTNLNFPILALDLRNDTGSALVFAVAYCVEDR